MKKIFFDTEFIEDGETIKPISIGLIDEDDRTYYAEFTETDLSLASEWVQENVIPHLRGGEVAKTTDMIAYEIYLFAGHQPKFYAWYGAYDWVLLAQIYGTMMDLPDGWPMFPRDVVYLMELSGIPRSALPQITGTAHNALDDAIWTKEAYDFIMGSQR